MPYYQNPKAYPAELIDKIIIRESCHVGTEAWEIPMDVGNFVAHMLQSCLYEIIALPPVAMVSAWTNYYIGQVQNGGHDQFIGNSGWEPEIRNYVHEGLGILGLVKYRAILADLEIFAVTDPRRFENCDWSDPTLEALDTRFHALPIDKYYQKHREWLLTESVLQVYPDDEYHAIMNGLADIRRGKRTAS